MTIDHGRRLVGTLHVKKEKAEEKATMDERKSKRKGDDGPSTIEKAKEEATKDNGKDKGDEGFSFVYRYLSSSSKYPVSPSLTQD